MLNNAVPGRAVHSDFRDYGKLLRVTKDTAYGQGRVGLWFDRNAANVYRTNIVTAPRVTARPACSSPMRAAARSSR